MDLNAAFPRTTEQIGRPVADATGPLAPQPRPAETNTTAPSRRPRVVVLAIAIAVLVAAASAAFVLRSRDRAPSATTLDPAHDPWADHPAVAPPSEPIPVTVEPAPITTPLPGALQAQIDLHPAESNVLLAISGSKLRASAAMKAATKNAPQLAELNTRCGFDLLATVDTLLIGGTMRGNDIAFDISARGRFASGAVEHCIAGVLGSATVTRDDAATRIEGGGHVVWVSHPDAATVFVTTRPDGNHLASTRDHGVRHGPLAPLLAMVDVGSTVWLVGQPKANTIELFPGVASPSSLFATAEVTDTIDVRGGLRFTDAATSAAATRVLRAKLDEMMTDPIAHGVLGNAKLSLAGRDTIFTVSIGDAFAAVTLQSLFKYLGDPPP